MKPGISKRLTRETQRRSLYGAWAALNASADAFTRRQTLHLFDMLRQAVGEQITRDAAACAGICEYDEYAYDHLARLMAAYREAVAVWDRQRAIFQSFSVKSIVEGIYAVLQSRLRLFEETADPAHSNPITRHKQEVLEKAAGYAAQHIASQARFFVENQLPGENGVCAYFRTALIVYAKHQIGGVLEATDYLRDKARDFCFKGLYAFYRDGLRLCVSELNTRFYLDQLDSEHEVLASLIKVQASALEFAVRHSPGAMRSAGNAKKSGHPAGATPPATSAAASAATSAATAPVAPPAITREQAAVQQILTLLQEAHQRFAPVVAETHRQAAEVMAAPTETAATEGLPGPGKPYAEFERFMDMRLTDFLMDATREAQLFLTEIAPQRSAFQAALDKETEALFELIRLTFYKTVYRFQRDISEEIIMAEEMTDAFERVLSQWPDISELPPEAATEAEILCGIIETIQIKVESLKENTGEFNEKSKKTIHTFTGHSKEVVYDDLLHAYDVVSDAWSAERPASERELNAFFEKASTLPVFAPYRDFYDKQENEYAAKINKSLLTFKKEVLLYEVSTYEEILLYSVSRLREAPYTPVRQAVALLDDTLAAIGVLLKKNNIRIIRPAPHDPFNGREHEVLMAEKQEGFNKGEIIKPLCSGYRQKDTVILRANVIAAK